MAEQASEIDGEAYAHLTVRSESLSPEELTRLVGLEPFRSWHRGDVNPDLPEHSRFRIGRTSGIAYRSRIDESLEAQKQLDDLEVNEAALAHATTHPEADAVVGVWSHS